MPKVGGAEGQSSGDFTLEIPKDSVWEKILDGRLPPPGCPPEKKRLAEMDAEEEVKYLRPPQTSDVQLPTQEQVQGLDNTSDALAAKGNRRGAFSSRMRSQPEAERPSPEMPQTDVDHEPEAAASEEMTIHARFATSGAKIAKVKLQSSDSVSRLCREIEACAEIGPLQILFEQKLLEKEGCHSLKDLGLYDAATVFVSQLPRFLLTGDTVGGLRLWNPQTGECDFSLKGHTSQVAAGVIAADGKAAVSASADGTVRMWSTLTGECSRTLVAHEAGVTSMSLSADEGLLLTASQDGTAKLWSLLDGECVRTFAGHEEKVCTAAFMADGQRVVTASADATAKIWAVDTGKCLGTLPHDSAVHLATLSNGGNSLLTTCTDHPPKMWDLDTCECDFQLNGHNGMVMEVAFSPDDRLLATACQDGTAALWRGDSGRCLRVLRGHGAQVTSVTFSADGKCLATASADSTARLWEVPSGTFRHTLTGHQHQVLRAVFSSGGVEVVTASLDGTSRLWNTATGDCIQTFKGHLAGVLLVRLSPSPEAHHGVDSGAGLSEN